MSCDERRSGIKLSGPIVFFKFYFGRFPEGRAMRRAYCTTSKALTTYGTCSRIKWTEGAKQVMVG